MIKVDANNVIAGSLNTKGTKLFMRSLRVRFPVDHIKETNLLIWMSSESAFKVKIICIKKSPVIIQNGHSFQLDILLNSMLVDELSTIVHTSRLEYTARRLTEKLKEMIPRQMVQVLQIYRFPSLFYHFKKMTTILSVKK